MCVNLKGFKFLYIMMKFVLALKSGKSHEDSKSSEGYNPGMPAHDILIEIAILGETEVVTTGQI